MGGIHHIDLNFLPRRAEIWCLKAMHIISNLSNTLTSCIHISNQYTTSLDLLKYNGPELIMTSAKWAQDTHFHYIPLHIRTQKQCVVSIRNSKIQHCNPDLGWSDWTIKSVTWPPEASSLSKTRNKPHANFRIPYPRPGQPKSKTKSPPLAHDPMQHGRILWDQELFSLGKEFPIPLCFVSEHNNPTNKVGTSDDNSQNC